MHFVSFAYQEDRLLRVVCVLMDIMDWMKLHAIYVMENALLASRQL